MKKLLKSGHMIYAAFFAVIFLLVLLVPYSVDDTYFAYIGIKDLSRAIEIAVGYGNGRVLGNFLSIILAQSKLIAAPVIAAGAVFIIYLINKVFADKSKYAFITAIISVLLILGMSDDFFGGIFAWSSSFSNYAPPLIICLLCILIIKNYDKSKIKPFSVILISILGFCGQLFSENSTVYNIAIAFVLLVICFVNHIKSKIPCFAWLLSSLIGGFAMLYIRKNIFVQTGFHNGLQNYQGVHLKSLVDLIDNAANNVFTMVHLMSKCFVLFIILSAVLILLMKKAPELNNAFLKKLSGIVNQILAVYPVYSVLYTALASRETYFNSIAAVIMGMVSLVLLFLYVLAIVYCALRLENKYKITVIAIIVFAVFTLTPFLIVSPVGPRCMLYWYVSIVCVIIMLTPKALSSITARQRSLVNKSVLTALGCVSIVLICVFANANILNKKVDNYCNEQIKNGATEIVVCNATESAYHRGHGFDYVYYNNEPGDVKITIIKPQDWIKEYVYTE